MGSAITILAGLSCAAWIYLVFFRGGFWRADQRLGDGPIQAPRRWPPIVAVIAARNEADVIQRCIASLLAQDYPRAFSIVLVDDDSSDATAALAMSAAAAAGGRDRLIVVPGRAAPAGWAGKVWAMSQGADQCDAVMPEARYLLFSDADIDHDRSSLRRLVALAEAGQLDLASLMVMLSVDGFWDRYLIPPFVFFFQMLYPFAWVSDPAAKPAAAGGCMLARRSALRAAGGLSAIRGALIDDCALARLIAHSGGKLWLGLTAKTRSLRPYAGFCGVWNMVARNAYTQLGHSPLRLVLCVAGMTLVYAVPVAVLPLASGPAAAMAGLAAYALMCVAYWPTIWLYRQAWPAALLLPFAAAFYMVMTIGSAWRGWRGRGGAWKGRIYPHQNAVKAK